MKAIIKALFCVAALCASLVTYATCQTTSIAESTPERRFSNNGNGTITDHKTDLMWTQCSEGLTSTSSPCDTGIANTYSWQAALQRAQTLNNSGGLAGYTDWRVPSIKELASIIEQQCFDPAINSSVFPNTPSLHFWSSSPDAGDATYAWGVGFHYGTTEAGDQSDINYLKTSNNYLRLVRGGQ